MADPCKLLFVGDVVLESKPTFSADLIQLFDNAQLRSCNFEAPIRGYGQPISKTGPHLNQDARASDWVKTLGFDLYCLANNHIYDYGSVAMFETIKSLPHDSVIGVGNESEAYKLVIKEIGSLKIGFLAYCENGYGALNGDRETGYAWINHVRVNQDIRLYKEQVDFLIVQVHAGVEMLDVPIPEWRDRYKELIDCGADIIIGHHPHVVQGYELYHDKYIFYSLGNFCFDYKNTSEAWNTGAMLELFISNDMKIEAVLHIVERKNNQVSLISSQKAAEMLAVLNQKLSNNYIEYVDRKAVDLWNQHHLSYYAKVSNGIQKFTIIGLLKHIKRLIFNRKPGVNMLWHNLFIESNIWIVKRAIRLLNLK